MKLQKKLLDTLFTNSMSDFFHHLSKHLESTSFTPFTLWKVENSICEAVAGTYKNAEGRYDLYDLGYRGENTCREEKTLEFFDEKININKSVFLRYMDSVYGVITFHKDPDVEMLEMETFCTYLGQDERDNR